MPDNIVSFPQSKGSKPPPMTMEDVGASVKRIEMYHMEACLEKIVALAFEGLCVAGYPVIDEGDDSFVKDMALIYNSFRSIMFKAKGFEHPLQEIADSLFVDLGDGYYGMTNDPSEPSNEA